MQYISRKCSLYSGNATHSISNIINDKDDNAIVSFNMIGLHEAVQNMTVEFAIYIHMKIYWFK